MGEGSGVGGGGGGAGLVTQNGSIEQNKKKNRKKANSVKLSAFMKGSESSRRT